MMILLVAAALGIAAVLLGETVGNELLSGGDDAPVVGQLTTLGANAFDPSPGDGSENDDEVFEAVDGDPDTAWTTEGYNNREFGNLKPGVGLVVQLDGVHAVDTIAIDSPTTGWAVEVYVAEGSGDDLEEWGQPVGGGQDLDVDPEFALDGATGDHVLIWITDLGDTVSGDFVRATIAEIVISGS
jgi:hypothetical protein